MNKSFKERLKDARKHAIAVLIDKNRLVKETNGERIPTQTLVALLGITFPNGKPITKGSENSAILHWHETGFGCYAPVLKNPTKRQLAASDQALMKSAIAETMENRRKYRGKEGEWK